MAARIVVVGSSNTDMILKLDRIPKPDPGHLTDRAVENLGAHKYPSASRLFAFAPFSEVRLPRAVWQNPPRVLERDFEPTIIRADAACPHMALSGRANRADECLL